MVGMEFQVMGGGEDVCQYGSGGLEAVNHGIPLAAKTGYEITADMGDYEYVTAPVDERTDKGIQDLMTACDNAAKDHSNISTALGLSAKAPKTEGYWKFGSYYLRQSVKMTAHPQATVGIKLDKLDTFVREYSKNLKTQIRPEYTGAFGESEEFSNSANWPQTPEQLNLAHGGTYRKLAEQQAEIIESIVGRPQNVISIRNRGIAESVNGFLRILASMVQNLRAYRAAHKFGNPTNAKSVMPLMPRTSLYDIVQTFPIDVQKAIVGKQLKGIINFIYGSDKSVPNTVLLAAQTYIVKKKVRTDELQLDKWLQNMPAVTGSQKSKTMERKLMDPFSGVAELYGTAETRHNLYPGMTRSTDIGYDAPGDPARQVDGMLIEIRDLQRDVALSNWKYVARDAAFPIRRVPVNVVNLTFSPM